MSLSRAERRAIGGRGRQLVGDQFNWEKLLLRYRAMYEVVVTEPR